MYPRIVYPAMCVVVGLSIGCKDTKRDSGSLGDDGLTLAAGSQSAAPIPVSTLPTSDRDKLHSLAQKVLGFIKNKDTEALVLMAAPQDRQKMSQSLQAGQSMYETLFASGGWCGKAVEAWQEEVGETRIKDRQARVKFMDLEDKRVAVVVFQKEDGVWYFQGVDNPSLDTYGSWGVSAR